MITLERRNVLLIKNKIKILRAEYDLTQEKLAKALNISRQAVISIEKYKYTPSLDLAFKISIYFNKPIDEIFIYEEEL